jgi:hypothetical protein
MSTIVAELEGFSIEEPHCDLVLFQRNPIRQDTNESLLPKEDGLKEDKLERK